MAALALAGLRQGLLLFLWQVLRAVQQPVRRHWCGAHLGEGTEAKVGASQVEGARDCVAGVAYMHYVVVPCTARWRKPKK